MHLQNVDILDFEIPCSSPGTPGSHPRALLTNEEGLDECLDVRGDGKVEKDGPEGPGRPKKSSTMKTSRFCGSLPELFSPKFSVPELIKPLFIKPE